MSMSKNRERIIKSARALFSDKDFEQVTIKEICANAGVANSTFYYHFKTKEELMDHLSETDDVPLRAEWIGLATMTDLLDQVIAACSMCAVRAERSGYMLTAQYYKRRLNVEKEDAVHQSTLDQEQEAAAALIARAQQQGAVKNMHEAGALAQAAIRLTSSVIVDWCVACGGFDLHSEVRRMLLLLLTAA